MLLSTFSNVTVLIYLLKLYASATIKRSPLETGYVTSISDDNNQHSHHSIYLPMILAPSAKEPTSSVLPATLLLHKTEAANQGSLLFPVKTYNDLQQKKSSTLHTTTLHTSHQSPLPHHAHITHLRIPSPQASNNHHHIVVWLPGRVYHHAYIPPHLQHQHLEVPTATRSHVVIHDGHRNRATTGHHGVDHFGGYGVGVDIGGQGAGHGWQVVGMLYNSF